MQCAGWRPGRPVWARNTGHEFRQRDPNEGAAPTHPTDVRVAFDGTALYVAVRAIESHNDRLVGMLTRRDGHRRPTGCV
jgi:hypothetical protein